MNKSQIQKLIKSKLDRQEMVTSARQEEEKKLARQMKEKDQAEERQKRAASRAPKSKPQEPIQVDQANTQDEMGDQVSPLDAHHGPSPSRNYTGTPQRGTGKFNTNPGSKSILEALTKALNAKDGPTTRRLIQAFNSSFGSSVEMEYDEPYPKRAPAPGVGLSNPRVDDSSQLLASISGGVNQKDHPARPTQDRVDGVLHDAKGRNGPASSFRGKRSGAKKPYVKKNNYYSYNKNVFRASIVVSFAKKCA
ncbi:uncharacterized protein MELLADRAFT_114300 [Melampsora larici-populina 98AG31]|uniref:Uncharacterized protein n=1 Tax=Melampsora larici-populina (strain 98AG31 / pathotype 3-4-7) TaxID=747676 RepID=F4SCY6_MELLP|nr:uncharacterized protein MELLADRAFT_114300 [Melampsora larici-populina 98AG31]EGF97490.1 hypothetical protein MELLADRAFT_114300 [Melampsora larici-populina 98AG31]